MLIRIGYEFIFDLPVATPMVLNLFTHPSRAPDLQQPEQIVLEPSVALESFIDPFGNHSARITAPAGKFRATYDNRIYDNGQPEDAIHGAALVQVGKLDRKST